MVAPTAALKVLDDAIADLEAKLNLKPGEDFGGPIRATANTKATTTSGDASKASDDKPNAKKGGNANKEAKKKKDGGASKKKGGASPAAAPEDQPDICKLEFKVGQIVKVWVHPDATKLYCEEIDVGEDSPRRIASGLRPHFTEEQMLGQRLLVVSNLKAKNLVGFKSHGMVLCAAAQTEGQEERVEFVEPPEGAAIGEIVTFEGLPAPQPCTAAQVEKKKLWQAASSGMQTTDDCLAAWNGHVFMTQAGPCRTKSIAKGPMR